MSPRLRGGPGRPRATAPGCRPPRTRSPVPARRTPAPTTTHSVAWQGRTVADVLDRLVDPAGELLARVDAALLAHGVPTDHAIVALLRRLGALPSDAMHAISACRPAPLRAAASELRQHAEGYAREHASLGSAPDWSG